MKKYTRRSVAEWQKHVDAWKGSGLTQTEYCGQHDINSNVFSSWKGKLLEPEIPQDGHKREKSSKTLPFVSLNVMDKSPQDHAMTITLPNGIAISLASTQLNTLNIDWIRLLCQIR